MTHAGGRPLKFADAATLERKIQAYFESCAEHWEEAEEYVPQYNEKGVLLVVNGAVVYDKLRKMVKRPAVIPTVTGLAVALDTSRETLMEYTDRPEYTDTIKKAKDFIHFATEQLLANGGAQPAGVIFSLKNNWGWKDKTDLDISSSDGSMSPVAKLTEEQLVALMDKAKLSTPPVD